MSRTAEQLLKIVNKKIRNAKGKLGGDSELIDIINEAKDRCQLDLDFVSAQRITSPFLLYYGIYEYPVPSDINYDKIIEATFEGEDPTAKSQFDKTTPKFLFDKRNPYQSRNGDPEVLAITFENGSPYLKAKITENIGTTQITNCNGYDDNGTWVIADDASVVMTDTNSYKESSSSILFKSAGVATDVSITNSILDSVDLTDYENFGKIFLWVKLPSTAPASITLKWGSSASAYFSKTITTRHNGLAFVEGWNLVGFDCGTATETGTVDITVIDYSSLTITNSVATAANYNIDLMQACLGKECKLNYYTKYLFKSVTGVAKTDITVTDDICILNNQEEVLLIDKSAQIALENLREKDDAIGKKQQYDENKDRFATDHPSEIEPEGNTYYRT